MKLPQMVSNVNKSKKYIVEFGGINRSSRFNEGELADSKNLSSDLLPFISQRGNREQLGEFESPTAIHAHNGIAVVDGTRFLYKADGKETFLDKMSLIEGKKQIAQLSNKIVVFPDIKFYDAKEDVAATFSGSKELPGYGFASGTTTKVFYTTIGHNYILIHNKNSVDYATEIHNTFRAGDVVSVSGSGFWSDENKQHSFSFSNMVIKSVIKETASITLNFDDKALFDDSRITEVVSANISKDVPALEHICECGGRVWGVVGNTIYASAYNDPLNFNKFQGLSSDSYTIEVSTPGEFTGCAAFTSHLVFFKENYIHRIYGNRPSNFNLVTSGAPGVQVGSYDSIKMLNERLFYKGVDGVYMYSGGMPVLISECLGNEKYTDAVAGVQGNKYYISMKNSKGVYELFSYDTLKGVFLKEDDTQMIDTTQKGGELLYIDGSGRLMTINGNQETDGIEWSAELREFNETVNEKKGYSRLSLRVELDKNAYMNAELALDSGKFELVKTVNRAGKNIVSINVPPNRCDSFKLRLSGKGGCRVMNLVREFVIGNEVR